MAATRLLYPTSTLFKAFLRLLSFLTLSLAISVNNASAQNDKHCWQNYAVKIKTQTVFNFNGSTPTRHKLEAFLAIRPLKDKFNNPQASVWAMQLHEVTQTGNGAKLPEEAFLETPFLFEVLENGLIGEFYFPTPLNAEQKDRLKGLAFYFQAQERTFSKKSRQLERDTLGSFEADYEYKDGEITKSKTAYHLDPASASLIHQVKLLSSENHFTKSQCLFSDLHGNEHFELSNEDRSYNMEVKQEYRVRLTPKILSPTLWSLPESFTDWNLTSEINVQLSEEELSGLRKRFLNEISNLNLLDLRPGDLAKWLTQFELVLPSIASYLKNSETQDAVQMRIFAALGLVDSVNSNRLLISLVNDIELDETNRFRALRALTSGTKPLTAEQKDKLTELIEIDNEFGSTSLQNAALMTIGAVISRREANEFSDALVSEVSNHLSPNISIDRQAALIASLGNTMRSDVITKVENYAHSDSPRIRSNVATSLGQIGGEKAKVLLSSMLHTEIKDRPQQAILSALSNYPLEKQDINKAAEIGLSSTSERTRKHAIVLLGKQDHQAQQVKIHLKEMMKRESSRKNFGLAAKNLVKLNQQSSSD